jgi:SAM-dependent methyltransferase
VDAKRDAPSVDIIQDIFEPLPFSDGMVAVILALGVIERVSPRTLPQVLGEFHRVLPEGGRLVIRTPSLRLIVEDYVHGANGVEFAAGEPADPRRAGPINPMMQRSCISFGGGRHNADSDQSSIEGESLASLCRAIGFSEARWRRVADDLSRDEIEVVALR